MADLREVADWLYIGGMVVVGACLGGLVFWIGYVVVSQLHPPRSFVVRVDAASRWMDLEPVVDDMGRELQEAHTAALAAGMDADDAVTWSWRLRSLERLQRAVSGVDSTTKAEAWLLARDLAVEIDRMRGASSPGAGAGSVGSAALAPGT